MPQGSSPAHSRQHAHKPSRAGPTTHPRSGPWLPQLLRSSEAQPAWLAQLLGAEGPGSERTSGLLLALAGQRAVVRRLQEQLAGLAQQGAGCNGAAERSAMLMQQAAGELAAALGKQLPPEGLLAGAAAGQDGLLAEAITAEALAAALNTLLAPAVLARLAAGARARGAAMADWHEQAMLLLRLAASPPAQTPR